MTVTQHPAGHPVGGNLDANADTPKKFSRFFGGNTPKKRQRLVMITSNARVLMCAAGTNDKKLKEEVTLISPGCAWRSFQDSKGLTTWLVETVSLTSSSTRLPANFLSSETSNTFSRIPRQRATQTAANIIHKSGSTVSNKPETMRYRKAWLTHTRETQR